MKLTFTILSITIALGIYSAANAHHPGENLDKFMFSEEIYFEVMDKLTAPSFDLVDADGNIVKLSDFDDKVVVLNFIFANCQDFCPLHAELIAEVQTMINDSPMKNEVQFLSITTDPTNDTSDVLKTYGPSHGLDPVNWRFLTKYSEQPENITRTLAEEYGLTFSSTDDGLQMHGVVTHIIDREGRFAARFHGLQFKWLNMVLYINGLINNWR